ncbi:hypothetical protein HNQ60_003652 [Povalibacter uvarum]|uniref:NlpC-P60 family protein n=1 Tax=Povalibacter uvarum TaxID=732238 RepID=A0A841HSB0_9GAMM|nr:SH3 domain-containing protein [Povalibacter uvarum]MBB6094765.1 hypothetical protein [Povalibacter uvarum]
MRTLIFSFVLSLLAACATPPSAEPARKSAGVAGVEEEQLDPDFWIAQAASADKLVLDTEAIAAQNQRLRQTDESVTDLARIPSTLTDASIRKWVGSLSERPTRTLFDVHGNEVSSRELDELMANVNLDAVPASRPAQYGLVVHRADLRTFPTRLRVFSRRGDTDIDRFQENALFPGTPVIIAHESRDGRWWFVVSPLYAAWIEKDAVAIGDANRVFEYTRKSPYLVVTGAMAHTVFSPERPEVSQLQLDMGLRVPLVADWPQNEAVNGQHPYTAHIVELPYRGADGSLQFTPALVPKTSDVAADYLPLTRANLLRQSFKFLGERYGWGHSYNARDCSGFVSEVYRSFGVELPRNTRDQGVSPAFDRITLTEGNSHEERIAILEQLHIGDLIYIPGHVMMVIGHQDGMPYIIHDTTGVSYREATGEITRVDLNAVSVTPLVPLLLDEARPMIDRIYSIQRMRSR